MTKISYSITADDIEAEFDRREPGPIMSAIIETLRKRGEAEDEDDEASVSALTAELDGLVDRLDASDELRPYRLVEEGYEYDTILARSLDAAADAAERGVERNNYHCETGTIYVDCRAEDILTDQHERRTVALDEPEPDCEAAEHDWQSPYDVLRGLSENPGVQGHGGGVVITEVCQHCGAYRVTDTWAQNPSTGEQGLHSVEYRDADEYSLAWVRSLRIEGVADEIERLLQPIDNIADGYDREGDAIIVRTMSDEATDEDAEAVEDALRHLDIEVRVRLSGSDRIEIEVGR